jgi:4-hydroxy-3-polyprenylbenzoate decarboxylase
MSGKHIVLALSGASGACYGLRLGEELLRAGVRLSLLCSPAGRLVLREECGLSWQGEAAEIAAEVAAYFRQAGQQAGPPAYYGENDFTAPLASGSRAPDAMVICPCSMGTLARIAAGTSGNLTERCPRETPLSEIHLENMLRLARMGVRIVPAMPAYYTRPRTIEDQVNFVVGKTLDALGIRNDLYARWGEDGEEGSGTGS